ncbi:hypothetical protein [Pseudomonas sp. Irchel 3E13]|uniref:hypothetical protein n=1 Tax=Pseudomonas sp. Irchel 3E13 TaxID=2008975 RepID=UPI000BA3F1BE|nr:hypothetical protein [Pseudomonas sp. Irchel 3E13]
MKFIGFTLITTTIASLGGCAMYDNAKKAQVEGVGTAQSAAIVYEFRAGDQMTIKHANSAPQKFASTATATDKVFAVMGMPSLEAAPPGSFNGAQLIQSTKEETIRYMSTDTASHGSTGKDLEVISLNAIGANIGGAGMALSLIGGSPKVDPRVALGFVICFMPAVEGQDMAAAVASCGAKVEAIFNKTVTEISRSYVLPNAEYRLGKIETPSGLKAAKVFTGRRGVLAAEGFAPLDRGGYPARIVAIPVGHETTSGSSSGALIDTMLFKSRGEVTSEQLAAALAKNLPKDTVFYLPDNERGPAAVY